ncbi:MAG: hypothetical protein IPK69_06915 [Phycisphaerales bacterium]|nr:MAG: hypothetical protein IPK69_06915 [Phycisphaerales bacterium]
MTPLELETIRTEARTALGDIRPASDFGITDNDIPVNTSHTSAGRDLPPYYIVYFLMIGLLKFHDSGRWEKVAWSIPIIFDNELFLIEYRKFGLGLFAMKSGTSEENAIKIVSRIRTAAKRASKYFDWLASNGSTGSNITVVNKASDLYGRYQFHLSAYKSMLDTSNAIKDTSYLTAEHKGINLDAHVTRVNALLRSRTESRWCSLSAIDCFFSWTEHIFIHIAILKGTVTTGVQVAELAEADWNVKFKTAIDLSNMTTKRMFDELVHIRRQIRNYNAHGAFGKDGSTFLFHTNTGAVPVSLKVESNHYGFMFGVENEIPETKAIETIEKFVEYLETIEPTAMRYIQNSRLPTTLSYALDGTYLNAMSSIDKMNTLIERLSYEHDRAANMDW